MPTTCLSMPPRFDRDLPNSMHQSMSHPMSGNGMVCNNGPSSNNNQILNGLNGGSNGGISNVAASLRKPLLEINGN